MLRFEFQFGRNTISKIFLSYFPHCIPGKVPNIFKTDTEPQKIPLRYANPLYVRIRPASGHVLGRTGPRWARHVSAADRPRVMFIKQRKANPSSWLGGRGPRPGGAGPGGHISGAQMSAPPLSTLCVMFDKAMPTCRRNIN